MSRSDEVRGAIAPAVAAAGFDLEDVTITSAGRRSVIRVVVDSDDGVDLDAAAEVSRSIEALLDAGGVMGEMPYVLEVTSPGVDRPLVAPKHWRRAVGRLVSVSYDDAEITGRLTRVTEGVVVIDVAGEARELEFARLGPGTVQLEFNRPKDPAATGGRR